MSEFIPFRKIPRLSRECFITEKIDGTNASIYIGEDGEFLTGSRTRWITPEKDNFGFSRWAHEHKDELLGLGVGHHFGEWWGNGINRGYGLKEKRFSLFNIFKFGVSKPDCCHVVPLLFQGMFETKAIEDCLERLKGHGSYAENGFMNPEGIIIFHPHANYYFKKTIENDEIPKGLRVNDTEIIRKS